ncbi:MAG: phenylalanine--tRNA ligase beta subunit-related protein [Candidatus Riflebacteria bacterium]|jgi:DNA/RNA-binding domain of Phe-tRNA-synthetase-like protein|nr:phenylalanine--tRNA ligase beta subunit-related protein [Candidatus Riflebacteria bacterium]
MKTSLVFSLPPCSLRIGLLEARNVVVRPSTANYQELINREVEPLLSPDFIYPDQKQKGIRSLLKTFGYHPSGRSRPASEFLFKDLQNRHGFNFINNAVDINNHLSLKSFLPISVIDLDKSGYDLCMRIGFDDESYQFNREGHELSLKKLLVIARQGGDGKAFGSPVKDSQATKVFSETKNLAFFVYTSSNITDGDELHGLLNQMAKFLQTETEASDIASVVVDACP